MTPCDPPWVVLHVPHDATTIPEAMRPQLLLDDDALSLERLRMTDHLIGALFVEAGSDAVLARAPVSRQPSAFSRQPSAVSRKRPSIPP